MRAIDSAMLLPVLITLVLCGADALVRGGRRLPRRFMATTDLRSAEAIEDLSLGAPRERPEDDSYRTAGGILVERRVSAVEDEIGEVEALVDALDTNKGVLLASSYEYPGRYARWTLGFQNPMLSFTGRDRSFRIQAENRRGAVFLEMLHEVFSGETATVEELSDLHDNFFEGTIRQATGVFEEEERSKQPSLFSVVRILTRVFEHKGDAQLGLYGAFGYDLTFQFDPIELRKQRKDDQRDLVLFIPDEVLVIDSDRGDAWRVSYEFEVRPGLSTKGLPRDGPAQPYKGADAKEAAERDTAPGAFAKSVLRAKEEFKVGNLFEAVLSQTFRHPCPSPPSEVFRRLRRRNPAPYGFVINLGSAEYLVGASPEMFVRCERTGRGMRVETCPISGTIARGVDALEDAEMIKAILANPKEESELTMCTDVDRNDKSRICEPGSVRVIGRRQIEMYSRLIHTVDHVEGYLRKDFDALDAFLCHTWAVTVTGAPKKWAIQFVEDMEATPRRWYGGAVGLVGFDGGLNTGLTLRTVRISDGFAEIRAGATLLYDSEPEAEEAETELKASAIVDAVIRGDAPEKRAEAFAARPSGLAPDESLHTGIGKFVLLVDHQDSFVHTLANYLRQTGAKVVTVRAGEAVMERFEKIKGAAQAGRMEEVPDLVVLSPGPGTPADFEVGATIERCREIGLPIFGVCLGLQGIVEYFGGSLGVLNYPMHGKPSCVKRVTSDEESVVLRDLPDSFEVARYHSLHGLRDSLPEELRVTAETEDGCIMAIEHKTYPLAAVQFHPESILTKPRHGLRMLANTFSLVREGQEEKVKAKAKK
mmetsp:Transcript_1234/g.5237  ORF Transcript_1234/g.5237 Transcript_1234/m.5237 type:complete len:819 (-) Transcript_1234:34-2490(-)